MYQECCMDPVSEISSDKVRFASDKTKVDIYVDGRVEIPGRFCILNTKDAIKYLDATDKEMLETVRTVLESFNTVKEEGKTIWKK